MAEYSSSQNTRQALIDAAGELFAEHGYAAVTTRQIAHSACENIGSIHYHFGGKDGLIQAVLDYASQNWSSDPLNRYFKENEKLLDAKEGQRKFVCGLIDLFYTTLFDDKLPEWCGTLSFQTIQRSQTGVESLYNNAVLPTKKAFIETFRRIKKSRSDIDAHIWFINAVSSMFLLSINPAAVKRGFPNNELPKGYAEELLESSKRNALRGLDLE